MKNFIEVRVNGRDMLINTSEIVSVEDGGYRSTIITLSNKKRYNVDKWYGDVIELIKQHV